MDVVLVQSDLGVTGLLILHEVPGPGRSGGEVRVHKPHPNTLRMIVVIKVLICTKIKIPRKYHSKEEEEKVYLLIDWIVFYAVSAIFQPYNGGDLNSNWEDLCRNRTESDVTSPPAAALFSTVVNGLVIQNVAGPLSLQVLQHKFRHIHTEKEYCVNFAL